MSSSPLSDHYKTLGVARNASLGEIRRSHHKLVLKCHPDKIQDASLKTAKQNEFQKVQEAYEILSDENRRQAYDDLVQKHELRKQMSNANPTARTNPFEYEIKTTDPQSGSYRSRVKIFTYQAPSEYFEEIKITTSKKPSNLGSDRKQPSKDDVKREAQNRRAREESSKRKQKDKERELRHERKKIKERKEKDKRRGTEEKRSKKTNVFDEEINENETHAQRPSEKKSTRNQVEDLLNKPEEKAARAAAAVDAAPRDSAPAEAQTSRSPKEKSMDKKWIGHEDFAGAYLQASRQKAAVPDSSKATVPEVPNPPTPTMRRPDSFATASVPNFNHSRYTKVPDSHLSDDESARKSARRREKKAADVSGVMGKKSKVRKTPQASTSKELREPPTTPKSGRNPTLQSHFSAPPLVREKASRIQAQEASCFPEATPLARSQTFSEPRSRQRRPEVNNISDSSAHIPLSRPTPATAGYTVENSRVIGVNARTSFSRTPNMSEFNTPSRSFGSAYFSPEPSVLLHTIQPQVSPRDPGANRVSLENVRYSRTYGPENVVFSTAPTTYITTQDYGRPDYYPPRVRREEGLYVS